MRKEEKKLSGVCHDCEMLKKAKITSTAYIESVREPEHKFQVVNAYILYPMYVNPKPHRSQWHILAVMHQNIP